MLKELGNDRLDDDYQWIEKYQGNVWTKDARKVGRHKSVLLGVASNRTGTPRERMKWKAVQLAWLYGIGVEEVLGEGRRQIAMRPKIRFYYWLRAQGLSYPQMGRLCGRDHTSIQHMMKQTQRYGLKGLGGLNEQG